MPRSKDKKSKGPKPASPKVVIDTSVEGDQAFLEAMQAFDGSGVPPKDRFDADSVNAGSLPARKPGRGTTAPVVIDLHGYTLREAKEIVIARIQAQCASVRGGVIHFRIITGKGRHSGQDGSVLAREVHAIVRNQFRSSIQRIEDAPADVAVGGLPIRGHFDVWLRA